MVELVAETVFSARGRAVIVLSYEEYNSTLVEEDFTSWCIVNCLEEKWTES